MSRKYKTGLEVPTNVLCGRLKDLAAAIADNDFQDFSMRIPAEVDRDADLVISEAARRLKELEQDNEHMALLLSGIAAGNDTRKDAAAYCLNQIKRLEKSETQEEQENRNDLTSM